MIREFVLYDKFNQIIFHRFRRATAPTSMQTNSDQGYHSKILKYTKFERFQNMSLNLTSSMAFFVQNPVILFNFWPKKCLLSDHLWDCRHALCFELANRCFPPARKLFHEAIQKLQVKSSSWILAVYRAATRKHIMVGQKTF